MSKKAKKPKKRTKKKPPGLVAATAPRICEIAEMVSKKLCRTVDEHVDQTQGDDAFVECRIGEKTTAFAIVDHRYGIIRVYADRAPAERYVERLWQKATVKKVRISFLKG